MCKNSGLNHNYMQNTEHVNVAGLPSLLEGVARALGPWWLTEDSTLWILIYLMMEFILDPVQQGIAQKNTVQKDPTIYGDKH